MKYLNLIDKYFNNSLNFKEQLLFDELIKNNEAFRTELLFQKDLKTVITSNQQNNLKNLLQNFEIEIETKKAKTKIIQLPKKWLIAASIILIIGLGSIFIKTFYYPSTEKLYAQNFEPYRNIIHPIVRAESSKSIEYSAFLAYENGNYYKALNLFNSINKKNYNYIPFYKAMCYLSLNNTSKAIKLLLPIANSTNHEKDFDVLSSWYLGLAYLKNGEEKKAINQFRIVANHSTCTAKKEQAKAILNYLE